MGALFLHLKPGEYLKKQYKTKKLVEKTSFSLQADKQASCLFILLFVGRLGLHIAVLNENGDCENRQLASDG